MILNMSAITLCLLKHLGSMLLTIFFGKFYVGVKKFGRFTNEIFFFKFSKRTTFLLRRKIFRKILLITLIDATPP